MSLLGGGNELRHDRDMNDPHQLVIDPNSNNAFSRPAHTELIVLAYARIVTS